MFSNGAEWDDWNAAWCETCAHDINGPEDGCPIILQLMMGEQPNEVGRGPGWSPQTVAYCTKYEPRPLPYRGEVVAELNGDVLVQIVGLEHVPPSLDEDDCGEQVRKLHRESTACPGDCSACGMAWPCPTIRALDGGDA